MPVERQIQLRGEERRDRRQRHFQELVGPHRQDDAGDPAADGEHQTLGQKLSEQPDPRRTKRATHSKFTLPQRSPNQ